MRLTKYRQEVLSYLERAGTTCSAGDIHRALPHINLVTIYRALDYLVQADRIKKIHLQGDEVSYEAQIIPHHHALCTDCNRVIHFTIDEAALRKAFRIPGFKTSDVEIVVRGHCNKRSHLHQQE